MSRYWLKKIAEARALGREEGWEAGFQTGVQFNNDITQTLLNDPDVMGRDVFGKGRMLNLHKAAEKMTEYYAPALHPRTNAESDVFQSRLDSKLKKIWKEDFDPFPKRYPYLLECSYEGGKNK